MTVFYHRNYRPGHNWHIENGVRRCSRCYAFDYVGGRSWLGVDCVTSTEPVTRVRPPDFGIQYRSKDIRKVWRLKGVRTSQRRAVRLDRVLRRLVAGQAPVWLPYRIYNTESQR
jgi:hypothetical protein